MPKRIPRTFNYEGTPFVGMTDQHQDHVRVYDTSEDGEPCVFSATDERHGDSFAAAEGWVAEQMAKQGEQP